MKNTFQLKNTVLVMALASAYPLQAYAAAGIAQFSAGDVNVRRGTAVGSTPLAKGNSIESGDVIETGAAGRAQIRFTDGSVVSLQPATQFKIDKYVDANDGKQDSFLVDLVRGGMRTITGLIGKRNRDNYKVTTSTATIGIRGSGYSLAYNPDGTLSVTTELDEIQVCTRVGCINLVAGESALILNNNTLPQRTNTRASLPTPPPRPREAIAAGDGVGEEGTPLIVATGGTPPPPPPPPPPSPTPPPPPPPPAPSVAIGMAISSVGHYSDQNAIDHRLYLDGALTRNSNGVPSSYVAAGNAATATNTGVATIISNTGSIANNDLLILGDWSSSTWATGEGFQLVSNFFVTGSPSPSNAISSLQGLRGEYSLSNSSIVESTQSYSGVLLSSSQLKVDFSGVGSYVDVKLDVSLPGGSPIFIQPANINENPVPTTTTYNLRGGAVGTGSGFSGTLSVSSESCISALSDCGTGSVKGFFSGATAQNAGLTYHASTEIHGTIGGAATFGRNVSNTAISPTSNLTNGNSTPIGAVITDGSGFYTDYNNFFYNFLGAPYTLSSDAKFTFKGVELISSTSGEGCSNCDSDTLGKSTNSISSSVGAIGQPTDSDFIGWGTWRQGTRQVYTPSYGTTTQMLDYVHYIAGKPTAIMPNAGSASYSLIGGTAPTATLNGQTTTGELLSTSNLSVNFGNYSVAAQIDTRFGAANVSINSTMGINGSSFSTDGCGNNAIISGIFTGPNAYRAGLTYGTTSQTLGNIRGAAAFQRTSGAVGQSNSY